MPRYEGTQHVNREGSQLARVRDRGLLDDDDVVNADPLVILLHGFTRHGDDLVKLGLHLEARQHKNSNLIAVTFSYPSYNGIGFSSGILKDRLRRYDERTDGAVKRRGLFLVVHSMGGLVARSFALDNDWGVCIRGIVMLGTPNVGVFGSKRKWVPYAISLAERLSGGPIPELQAASCPTIRELTKADSDKGKPFLDQLNDAWKALAVRPPTYTISGGRNDLDLYDNPRRNLYANMGLQQVINSLPNDGLIAEVSVDMCPHLFIDPPAEYKHYNSYPEYPIVNHSNLINNQALADEIVEWIEVQRGTTLLSWGMARQNQSGE